MPRIPQALFGFSLAFALVAAPSCWAPIRDAANGKVQPQEASAQAALIPREVLFGNPDRAGVQVSPDGRQLGFLAPVNGVLNVWVGPLEDPSAARAVTKETNRGIRIYFWAYTNDRIVYLQDTAGDENWHVYCVDLKTLETRDLTPIQGVNARIQEVSPRFPGEILVGLNDADPRYHAIYRIDLRTGERKKVQENGEFLAFATDDDYRVRYAAKMDSEGGIVILKPDGEEWVEDDRIPMEDTQTTRGVDFDKSGKVVYTVDSRGRNTGALFAENVETREKKLLAEDPRADVGQILIHPTEKTVQAVSFTYERTRWKILDPSIQGDWSRLEKADEGELSIASRSLDDRHWIAAFLRDDGPVRFYHWDRGQRRARFIFSNNKALETLPLVPMRPVVFKSRDGWDLVSYLSLPGQAAPAGATKPAKPLPMVLYVHGGPWSRDSWGYHPMHQMLSNRGYAVLSVNFRGSTGFGKDFVNAGNLEWGAKMHDDLLDAVGWAVKEGIADPKRVAIMGGSYGGYATLVGITMTPKVFACGVGIVGPSNIATLLKTIPPYWKPMMEMWKSRVGDVTTKEGVAFLDSRSPLTYVGQIEKPLLIGQGANDPRVKQSESDQIVRAMRVRGIPVTYVLFADEGHGFARPENRLAFYAITEAFLAKHLGGRFEPIGAAFKGSSVKIPVGEEEIPGLVPAPVPN